jgi:hypothetical protein
VALREVVDNVHDRPIACGDNLCKKGSVLAP